MKDLLKFLLICLVVLLFHSNAKAQYLGTAGGTVEVLNADGSITLLPAAAVFPGGIGVPVNDFRNERFLSNRTFVPVGNGAFVPVGNAAFAERRGLVFFGRRGRFR